ncbi:DUF6520 family protein [Sinomicrobium soli]|uniref:DUF6520 family protein n=1 Tax=Sinomicrobium sp. N-1-3-6 TaxID=2219864 RepID=UPI000DCE4D87|nr:DUF6520 family protein [Sinomicrobium sp. N-1-3-6]RAV30415.1 hypothetical protein DN748_02605 [Sinomicrobium sp. N-1-3-6]
MKTKNWMLSVAMFAIAIVGAFAISSTAQTDYQYISNVLTPPCQNVNVPCDRVESFQCRVDKGAEGVKDVWETGCAQAVFHSTSDILPEITEP